MARKTKRRVKIALKKEKIEELKKNWIVRKQKCP